MLNNKNLDLDKKGCSFNFKLVFRFDTDAAGRRERSSEQLYRGNSVRVQVRTSSLLLLLLLFTKVLFKVLWALTGSEVAYNH